MNEIEKAIDILKNMAEDCDDCKYYKECNGNGICYDAQDHVFEFAIKAKKSQSEREKMRCENCSWFKQNCCSEVIPIKPTDFCSYFEPKEVTS